MKIPLESCGQLIFSNLSSNSMDVKITFYRMLIFSVVTAMLTVSIFTVPAITTTHAQTLTGGGVDNTGTTTSTTPPEGTSSLTFTLKMGDSGGGVTSTTAIPPSTVTETTPSTPTTSDTTASTATTTSAATSSSNLSTRNIGIEVIVVRGSEATIILPINVTIPGNVNNLELCASATVVS